MSSVLIIALPLISSLIASCFSLSDNKKILHYICSSILLFAALLAFRDFLTLASGELQIGNIIIFKWISVSNLDLYWHLKGHINCNNEFSCNFCCSSSSFLFN